LDSELEFFLDVCFEDAFLKLLVAIITIERIISAMNIMKN
jgi:hypothetical protein